MVSLLIARVESWLAAHRPDYLARLRPGVTDAQLDDFEARFSLRLPDAFRELYRWRDGQQPLYFASFQGNREFSPLESVSNTKELFDSMIGHDFNQPGWWRRGWVPFLDNGGGSHLCVDVTAEDGGLPGQLVAFWKADGDRPVEHLSLEAWLADFVESMESGGLV